MADKRPFHEVLAEVIADRGIVESGDVAMLREVAMPLEGQLEVLDALLLTVFEEKCCFGDDLDEPDLIDLIVFIAEAWDDLKAAVKEGRQLMVDECSDLTLSPEKEKA